MEPNVKEPLQISTSTQLQYDGIQDQEHNISIQLETPECNILGVNPPAKTEPTIQLESPETDILTVNPMPENESTIPLLLESPASGGVCGWLQNINKTFDWLSEVQFI